MNLEIIKDGLSALNRVAVSEHLGNYPMTDAEGEALDTDLDPGVRLIDAASAAERIVDVLIANPGLAQTVAQAMEQKRAPSTLSM